jgi:tetratricopeptide (TPR) repeat protein
VPILCPKPGGCANLQADLPGQGQEDRGDYQRRIAATGDRSPAPNLGAWILASPWTGMGVLWTSDSVNSDAPDRQSKAGASGRGTRWASCAILGATCALVIGVFAWSAKSGLLEARASRANDTYYNLLVRALRAGQLNLLMEVPPGFAQLADPYDPVANRGYRSLEGHPLHDLSYYKGKLYLYFGITPALVLFGPYAALTGHYLLHRDAVVIFCSVGFLASAGLLWAIWRRYFAEVSVEVIAAGTLALGLASFVPMVLPRCDVYEVAISCGYALMMLALAAIWGALHQPRRRGWWLAAASLACGLAVGARPSLVFGAAILLVPVMKAWRERRPISVPLLAATGPIALVGLGLMFYNALRFDNPFEFGMHYALASPRMDTVHDFSWRYLGFNSWVYFLAPASWSARFPFVHDIAVPPLPAGHFGTEHPFGVLTNLPLVWLALATPLVWRGRPTDARSLLGGFLAALAWVFGACALTLGFFFAACIRYQGEFVPTLVLLAVLGIFGLERALAPRPAWRCAARWAWGLLLAFSLTFNLLVSVILHAECQSALGSLLLERGQVNQAAAHLQTALVLQPDNADAHYSLGNTLLKQGQIDQAIREFQEAIRLKPHYADVHNNLASALVMKGQIEAAIRQYQEAIRLKPDYALAYNNLGNTLLEKGQIDEALRQFQEALRLKPADATAHHKLGLLLACKGQWAEAIAHYQQVLALQPGALAAQNNLAWLLATCPEAALRNGANALALAQELDRLSGGKDGDNLDVLAAAYAETGQFPQAVEAARRALALAATQTNLNAEEIRARLRLYQDRSPYHEPPRTGVETLRP